MASRGAFGFRSAKSAEKAAEPKEKDRLPGTLSRKPSITSPMTSSSKPPGQSTSFFSRSRARAKVEPPVSGIPVGRVQYYGSTTSIRSEPDTRLAPGQVYGAGLGISPASHDVPLQAPKSGKQGRNVLRRKAPLNQPGKYTRTESSASSYEPAPARPSREIASTPEMSSDPFAGSVLGISIPAVSSATSHSYTRPSHGPSSEFATSSSRMANFNNRNAPPNSSTPSFPTPTPTFVHDSGSSTRRSESPGNFSRTSTPTSMSSQSPGVGTPAKAPLRRQISPTRSRPPVTRRKFPPEEALPSQNRGLTAVRESATSSSSSSTIKASEQRRDGSQVRSDRSTPLPPSPPTRQSSKRLAPREDLGIRREVLIGVPEDISRSITSTQASRNDTHSTKEQALPRSFVRSPPPRPSREGTPRLDDAFEPSPVIHTRLPPLQTSGSKRRPSLDQDTPNSEPRSALPHSSRNALGRSPSVASSASSKPSRMPSPNPPIARLARELPTEQSRTQKLPTLDTDLGAPRTLKEPSPPSATPNKSSSRFVLFTKRTRSPLEITPIEGADKAIKKGPAAGTGHEGYGKYSRRGRSGSTSTSASRGRSTSSASAGRTSTSRKSSLTSRDEPIDDFLSARLAPVIIPGGGRAADSPFHGSRHYPSSSGDSYEALTSSEEVSTTGFESVQQHPVMVSSESSGSHQLRRDYRRLPHRQDNPEYLYEQRGKEIIDPRPGRPTLAARRSAHRSQVFGQDAEPLKLPGPIDVRAMTTSPGIDSRDTIQSSIRSDASDDISEGHEGNWLKSKRPDKRLKSPRKWNFFHRTQVSPRRRPEPILPRSDDDEVSASEMTASVSHLPEGRSVPFYALLDGSELDNLGQIGMSSMAPTYPPLDQNIVTSDFMTSPQEQEHRLSTLLPSPPKLNAEFPGSGSPVDPPVFFAPPKAPSTEAIASKVEPTPSLATEPRKPRLQQVGRIPRVISKRDRPHKPPPQSFSRPFARHLADSGDSGLAAPSQRDIAFDRPPLGIQTDAIPSDPWGVQDSAKPVSAPTQPSKNFDGTTRDEFLSFPLRAGSQVSGVSGSSSSGILSFAAVTAVVPEPGTAPEEDEVWNEYNEFLDTVGSSPAQLSNESRNPLEQTLQKSQCAPSPLQVTKEASITSSPKKLGTLDLPTSSAPTRPLPSPPDRSKLLSADFPSSTGTISDLVAGYGDRNRSSAVSQRKSGYTASRYSTSSIESDADSLANREGSQENAPREAVANPPVDTVDTTDLRLKVLRTSRWLSFDRVLFSPAHTELGKHRVLVLDRLENDDWSFYCAETYQDASIFNLSQRASTPQRQNVARGRPKNHRQIQFTSLGNRFPFPPAFFAVVVLRFPVATTEAECLHGIAECMRVLRPGGYLEMSVIDLDMVNMGNKARKALRELKVRMQVSQPGVSLKPLSDSIQKMAKRSGFGNLQRGLINIPVAGLVSNSRSNSIDAKSGSLEDLRKKAAGRGDGGLAKTLPQVGRWWFTQCYEINSLPYGDVERSIWNDRALLEECEKKETGFKLLLCYAQKPLQESDPGHRQK